MDVKPKIPLSELNDFIRKLELQALETSEERTPLYEEVGLKDAKLVLDVGCGSGTVTKDIANYSKGKIISVDGSKYMIKVASNVLKNNKNIELLISSAESLPFENNVFDIITCNLLLMWANNPQIVVNEMARVVKTGGKVLASLEPDYGGKLHYPENPKIDPIFAGKAIRKKGGDPHIGRKLRLLFVRAGLSTKIGIGNNRICYIKTLKDAGLSEKEIDKWEYEYLKSLDDGIQLNFFPQFYAIGIKK